MSEAEQAALERGWYQDSEGNWVDPERKGRSVWFWIAVVTSPIWLLPAAAIGFVVLCAWLIATLLVFGMMAVFAVLGKDEWIEELNRLPWVGDILE